MEQPVGDRRQLKCYTDTINEMLQLLINATITQMSLKIKQILFERFTSIFTDDDGHVVLYA